MIRATGTAGPPAGRLAPERVIGVHVNGATGFPIGLGDDEIATLTDLERDRLARVERFMTEEFGYIAIQSTRPQTLAYGLTDSPVGQLAWLMDKVQEWTFPREALPETLIDVDLLLANATLYWLTGTAGTAGYVGYAQPQDWEPAQPSGVPTGVLNLAHDVGIRSVTERENSVVRWVDREDGGHFAAWQTPGLLVEGLRAFVADLR